MHILIWNTIRIRTYFRPLKFLTYNTPDIQWITSDTQSPKQKMSVWIFWKCEINWNGSNATFLFMMNPYKYVDAKTIAFVYSSVLCCLPQFINKQHHSFQRLAVCLSALWYIHLIFLLDNKKDTIRYVNTMPHITYCYCWFLCVSELTCVHINEDWNHIILCSEIGKVADCENIHRFINHKKKHSSRDDSSI